MSDGYTYEEVRRREKEAYERGLRRMRDCIVGNIIGWQNDSYKPWDSEAQQTANEICKMITERYGEMFEDPKGL